MSTKYDVYRNDGVSVSPEPEVLANAQRRLKDLRFAYPQYQFSLHTTTTTTNPEGL